MDKSNPTRRKFIFVATGTATFGAVAASTVPILGSLGMDGGVKLGRPITVDLRNIPEGSQIKIIANGAPVFIRHRAQWEIDEAEAVDTEKLPHAETDEERLRPRPDGTRDPRFLIVSGVCSHFGAVLRGEQNDPDPYGEFGGWYCYSHGAHFDTSGRIRKGPAPRNMEIPDFKYITEDIVEFSNHKFLQR